MPEPSDAPPTVDPIDDADFYENDAVLEGEPIVRSRSVGGVFRRRRGRSRGVRTKYKRAGPRRASRRRPARVARGGGGRGSDSPQGVTVYDFEDDNLDGEVLRPDGAAVSSRQRATAPPSPVDIAIGNDDQDVWGAVTGTEIDATYGESAEPGETAESPSPLQALPAPKVNASALSVIIPATGQAVRYEQLLLDANQTQTITIDARRRLRRR